MLGLCWALWMQESSSVQCPHLLTPPVLPSLPPLLQSSPALQPPVKHSLLFMLFLSGCSSPQVVGMSPDLIKSSEPPVVSLFMFHKVKRHLGCAGGQRASPRAESRTDPPQAGGWWEGGSTKADQSLLLGKPLWNRLGHAAWADFFITHPEMPVVAAEVPGISQDVLAGLTAPLDSPLPFPSVFSAGSAPSQPVPQFFAHFLMEGFLGGC